MNPQSPALVQVRTTDALIAVIPHLLGFTPECSMVIVAAEGPRGRVRLAFRFDLPNPPDPQLADEIANYAATLVTRNQVRDVLAVGYGPGVLVTPVADRLREALPAAGVRLHDVLRVQDGRYWSYLCPDPACCPPADFPSPRLASTQPPQRSLWLASPWPRVATR